MDVNFVAGQSCLKTCAFLLVFVLLRVGFAVATDNHAYKAGEYAVISEGKSPDGCWSIAAHGDALYGYDGFGLYLMREPAHKKLALLRTGDHLDTAPLSIIALWAPDSSHVVLLYRIDRHVLDMQLFGVANGKVRVIKVPSLVNVIGQGHHKPGVGYELPARYYRVTWQKPDCFALEEFDVFDATEPIFRPGLKSYLKVEQEGTGRAFTSFSAGAVCKITQGDKLRFVGINPLSEWPRTIVYSPHLQVDPERGLYDTETTVSSLEAQKGQQ